MKKRTKLTLGGIALFAGAILLSSCTASFCSNLDKAHILYAFDYGVSDYYDHDVTDADKGVQAYRAIEGNDNVWYVARPQTDASSGIGKTKADAIKSGFELPSLNYYVELDKLVLSKALEASGKTNLAEVTYQDVLNALDNYGYLKFYSNEADAKLWDNWTNLNQELKTKIENGKSPLTLDDLPSNDYAKLYQKDMNSLIATYRSCLSIDTGDYGYYGYANGTEYRPNKVSVEIESKSWSYAWKKGPMEGLLVYPIGWLTETLIHNFKNGGVPGGLAQLLGILVITFIVRSLMLFITLKQTTDSAKMQAIQPEMAKIQAKYPNANTNNYEKQQQAMEMSKLYKKHKINPLSTLLAMFVQFPVFICVWSALQGSASISSDSFLNLHLSDPINTVLFNGANWANGSAVTALILFLLMAASQVLSMLLPQWLQKKKRKGVANLGKNPAQTQQQSQMKMFTYIMMAMIIIMGFTLVSAMGVYWFVGALFSIVQHLVVNAITASKAKKKGR